MIASWPAREAMPQSQTLMIREDGTGKVRLRDISFQDDLEIGIHSHLHAIRCSRHMPVFSSRLSLDSILCFQFQHIILSYSSHLPACQHSIAVTMVALVKRMHGDMVSLPIANPRQPAVANEAWHNLGGART